MAPSARARSRSVLRRRGVDAAGVDRHRDDRAADSSRPPRAPGTRCRGRRNRPARWARRPSEVCCMGFSDCETVRLRRSISRRWARASLVAMKMVSSPEMVPTTSGHSALSIATATLGAAPIVVLITVMRRAGRRAPRARTAPARRNRRWRARSHPAAPGSGRRPSARPSSRRSRLTEDCVTVEAVAPQQLRQIALPAHHAAAQDAQDGVAAIELLAVGQHGSLCINFRNYAYKCTGWQGCGSRRMARVSLGGDAGGRGCQRVPASPMGAAQSPARARHQQLPTFALPADDRFSYLWCIPAR